MSNNEIVVNIVLKNNKTIGPIYMTLAEHSRLVEDYGSYLSMGTPVIGTYDYLEKRAIGFITSNTTAKVFSTPRKVTIKFEDIETIQ